MRLPIPSGCGLGVAMGAARKRPDEAVCINRFHPGLRCMPNYPLVLYACDSGDRTGAPDTDTLSAGPGHHQLSSKHLVLWRQRATQRGMNHGVMSPHICFLTDERELYSHT